MNNYIHVVNFIKRFYRGLNRLWSLFITPVMVIIYHSCKLELTIF